MRSDILSRLLLLLLWASIAFPPSVLSLLVNVTVDDQLGDPNTKLFPDYSPNDGTWHIGSRSEDCPSCFINPSVLNLTQVHNQTWHDATSKPDPLATITVRFNGSAVYVFNIVVNTLSGLGTDTFSNISFSIDGDDVGVFMHSPDPGAPSILYNQLVYNNTTLNDGPHTLVMTAGNGSLILFDYFIYTTQSTDSIPATSESSSSTPTSTSTLPSVSSQTSSIHSAPPVGKIVGGVLGGIALVGVAIGAFFLGHRRARSRAAAASTQTGEGKLGDNGGGRLEGEYGVREDPPARAELGSPPHIPSTAMTQSTSLDDRTSRTHTLFMSTDASRPDTTHLSDVSAIADVQAVSSLGSTSMASSSPKRRAEELTERLETLQRSRSALSSDRESQSVSLRSQSEAHGARGTEAAIRELEAEMGRLRGALSTLNERLADRGDGGLVDPLPVYME